MHFLDIIVDYPRRRVIPDTVATPKTTPVADSVPQDAPDTVGAAQDIVGTIMPSSDDTSLLLWSVLFAGLALAACCFIIYAYRRQSHRLLQAG